MEPVGRAVAATFTLGLSEAVRPLMSKPKISGPSVPQPGQAPSTETQAVQQASSEASARRSKTAGYRSTILPKLSQTPLKETIGA
jgi:hypothetical protein